MQSLLVVFALLVANTFAIERPTASRTLVVRGIVTDSTSGAKLGAASIVISHPGPATPFTSLMTGADGRYVATVTVPDTLKNLVVRVRYLGYKPGVHVTRISGDTVTVNFGLARDSVIAPPEPIADRLRAEEKSARAIIGAHDAAGSAQGYARALATNQRRIGPLGAKISGAPISPTTSPDPNTEEYALIEDNRFLSVASAPLSTFSVDVDRASYTNVRRYVNDQSAMPPKDAVRIEELVNYFPYDYAEPTGRDPISITTDVGPAPWNPTHRIVRIGLQTQRIRTEKLPPSNLVFLLDVSGSMSDVNKLPLVKQAFRMLVNQLREQDRVAIVVYAGNAGLVLPSTSASHKETILDAIERLEAGGSTAGGAGIQLAYDVARTNFVRAGNNRVILATDGDFNVGVSNTADLDRLVEQRRKEGTYLTVLGFGMGNYKDSRLESLADKGNGNYAYIDNLMEARKVFVHEFGATLVTVAKDVKLQVEFNPAMVQAYRLIGYENRLLANEDFTNDQKDAGDLGAGHSVTALYDIVPVGVTLDVKVGTTDSLRYRRPAAATQPSASKELLFVNVRYKPPKDSVSRLMQHPVFDAASEQPDDFSFAVAVASYGMLLRNSEFKGSMTYDAVLALAKQSAGDDTYRQDFITLVENTKRVARGVASGQDR